MGKTPNRAPNRTRKRPVPYRKAPTGMLLRQGLGLPIRTKAGKVKLPSTTQRRRARRTLRLRGLAYIAAARHLPGKLWDAQYRRVPQPPLNDWSQPTIPDLIPIAPRRPAIAIGPSPTTTEVPRMSITDVVSDAFAHISGFQAESATEVEQLITEQPEMFKNIGQHYMTLADRMVSEMPFDAAVADAVRDLGAAISAVGDVATQVHQTMRDVHEPDFTRIENPRPREGMWNEEVQ